MERRRRTSGPCAGRRGAGTMTQDAESEVCPGRWRGDVADVAV